MIEALCIEVEYMLRVVEDQKLEAGGIFGVMEAHVLDPSPLES